MPLGELLAWADDCGEEGDDLDDRSAAVERDRDRLRRGLARTIARPEIREALFLASPDLEAALEIWQREPQSKRGRGIERALARYFARMCSRPTPFGLFAGWSLGEIGGNSRLELGPERQMRHSRVDAARIATLADALAREPSWRASSTWIPNETLYRAGGQLRYVETRGGDDEPTHHLIRVRGGPRVEMALDQSAADGIAAPHPALVETLIEAQLLVSALRLRVTGREPLTDFVARLPESDEKPELAARLDEVKTDLAELDTIGVGARLENYRRLHRCLERLPGRSDARRLIHVDLLRPARARLGDAVLAELVRGVELLHSTARPRHGALAAFREAFRERFRESDVPLVEALDDEVGVGFPPSGGVADPAPLLRALSPGPDGTETDQWSRREDVLLRKLARARGDEELQLEQVDIEAMADPERMPLPGAFAAVARLASRGTVGLERGDFRLFVKGIDGPSGARLLGRLCLADQLVHEAVERHLRAEEALDPEAVFAEIVHLPDQRLADLLVRPRLREWEIPYLGDSAAEPDRRIPVTDLLVSVAGERIVLRSERLGRRVVPRLTSPHNFSRGIPVYRFLCELQQEGVASGLVWDWGPLGRLRFLPRVVSGRLVLSRARWNLDRLEREMLSRASYRDVRRWQHDRGIPRVAVLVEDGRELVIDFGNVLSVDGFLHVVRGPQEAAVLELFPPADELCVEGPDGRFLHELVVPFVHVSARGKPPSLGHPQRPRPKRFIPGSEWVYAKLYGGPASMDGVLTELVAPLAEAALAEGIADRWFFLRYGDPEHHLRFRLHGERAALAELIPELQSRAAHLLDDGRLWRVQLDTYEPEVHRYGGEAGLGLSEQLFHIDSEAVVELLAAPPAPEDRWRLALLGMRLLLADLGIEGSQLRALLEQRRDDYRREFRVDASQRKRVGARFREERTILEALLAAESPEPYRRRSRRLAPLISELRRFEVEQRLEWPVWELAKSYIHLHANRMLRSRGRVHEVVLYDFLARLAAGEAGRGARAGAES